jgi:glycosyltransferase involved in cell wall biosynthesis
MRTLLYFRTHFDDPTNTGVIDKCKAIALGFGVDGDSWFFNQNGLQHEGPDTTPSYLWKTPKRTWRHLFLYYFAADRYLKRHIDFRQYEVFYIRHLPAHPMFLKLLKKAKRQNPSIKIIIELPTWPYDGEIKGSTAQLVALVDRTYRKKMANYTDYFVHFGPETEIWGVPTLRMTNGIEVEKKPLRQWKDQKDGVLRLLAVGNWTFTMGLERVFEGIKTYLKSGKKAYLHVVGEGVTVSEMKQRVKELDIEEYVQFHPSCLGATYDRFFDEADVAIGKLFIPAKVINYTSSLRHRDYCARGIPFVLAGNDSDMDENWPFVLHFPRDTSPIDIDKIEVFYKQIQTKYPNHPNDMRTFASEHLDWSVKIKKMIHSI